MSDIDKVFAGSIPEMYDRYFVPLIFEPYARDLAERLAKINPKTVLETAAGTGVLTRAMVRQLPQARITATDLNQPMLDWAKTTLPSARVTWQQADALALPFEDESFDAVVCQFGVMFFPDRLKGYREARRVLKPGGHFLFNSWDRISENEFADVITQALAEVFPKDPPRFLARTPHGYNDVAKIRADVAEAGFQSISTETKAEISAAPTARDPALAYCQGTPLRSEIEARDATRLQEATEFAAKAIAQRYGPGPVQAKIAAHIIVAAK